MTQAEWTRRYRQTENGRQKTREANARYRQSPKGQAARRVEYARYGEVARERYPDQYRAREAVKTAIRNGTLTRPGACESCGARCHPDGHHHLGYAVEHWLSVQWLCKPCHAASHR